MVIASTPFEQNLSLTVINSKLEEFAPCDFQLFQYLLGQRTRRQASRLVYWLVGLTKRENLSNLDEIGTGLRYMENETRGLYPAVGDYGPIMMMIMSGIEI